MLKLEAFLPYRLSVVSNALSDRVARAYKTRFGLRIPEWRVIAVVAERGETSQAGLVEATAMDKMTVSRAVATLAARGLLVRSSRDQNVDRRTPMLTLSADGKALHAEIAPLALSIEAAALAAFSPEERALLMQMLDRLEACAKT